jgi:putative membrane protein
VNDRSDEVVDATRRTRLAAERTTLAWWRTALTSFAVAVGAGKIAPDVTGGRRWPYEALGAGYAALGLLLVLYGLRRQRAVDAALDRGEFQATEGRFLVLLAGCGVLLGTFTLVIVVVNP